MYYHRINIIFVYYNILYGLYYIIYKYNNSAVYYIYGRTCASLRNDNRLLSRFINHIYYTHGVSPFLPSHPLSQTRCILNPTAYVPVGMRSGCTVSRVEALVRRIDVKSSSSSSVRYCMFFFFFMYLSGPRGGVCVLCRNLANKYR